MDRWKDVIEISSLTYMHRNHVEWKRLSVGAPFHPEYFVKTLKEVSNDTYTSDTQSLAPLKKSHVSGDKISPQWILDTARFWVHCFPWVEMYRVTDINDSPLISPATEIRPLSRPWLHVNDAYCKNKMSLLRVCPDLGALNGSKSAREFALWYYTEGETLFPDKRMIFDFGPDYWIKFHFCIRIRDKITLCRIKGWNSNFQKKNGMELTP